MYHPSPSQPPPRVGAREKLNHHGCSYPVVLTYCCVRKDPRTSKVGESREVTGTSPENHRETPEVSHCHRSCRSPLARSLRVREP
ncbi:unnamed protein product [Arabidopsis thaliana]|uniref:Uncharacterized protein n=1 Tax=Arabidopsis thaliana TaxID=3702 RepID=A0A5S9Y9Z9_ARATH|nr:unnamed protein product [Arabidopsis thaliana]